MVISMQEVFSKISVAWNGLSLLEAMGLSKVKEKWYMSSGVKKMSKGIVWDAKILMKGFNFSWWD